MFVNGIYQEVERREDIKRIEQQSYEYLTTGIFDKSEEEIKLRLSELNKDGITNFNNKYSNVTVKEQMAEVYNVGEQVGQNSWSDLTPAQQFIAGEGNWVLGEGKCKAKDVLYTMNRFVGDIGLTEEIIYEYIVNIPKSTKNN